MLNRNLQTKETEGDKSRSIIRHLHETNSDSDFDKFLVGLKSSQPNVASRINSVKNQVVLSRSHKDTDSVNNFASDFDPGINVYYNCLILMNAHIFCIYIYSMFQRQQTRMVDYETFS